MSEEQIDSNKACCLGDAWDILMDHLDVVRREIVFLKKIYPKESKGSKHMVDIPNRTKPPWVKRQEHGIIDLISLPDSIAKDVTDKQQEYACKIRDQTKKINIPNFRDDLPITGFHVVYDTYDVCFESFPAGVKAANAEIMYAVDKLKDDFRNNQLFSDLLNSTDKRELILLDKRRVKGKNLLGNFYSFLSIFRKCSIVQSSLELIRGYEEEHKQSICGAETEIDALFGKHKLRFKGIKQISTKLIFKLNSLTHLKEHDDTPIDYKDFINDLNNITQGLQSFHVFKDEVIKSMESKYNYNFIKNGLKLTHAIAIVAKLFELAKDKVGQFDYNNNKKKRVFSTLWNQWKHSLNNMSILRDIFKNSLFIAVAKNVVDLSKMSYLRQPAPVLQKIYNEYTKTVEEIQQINGKIYKGTDVDERKMLFMDLIGIFDKSRKTSRVIERYDPFRAFEHVEDQFIPLKLDKLETSTEFIVGPTASKNQIIDDDDSEDEVVVSDDDDNDIDGDNDNNHDKTNEPGLNDMDDDNNNYKTKSSDITNEGERSGQRTGNDQEDSDPEDDDDNNNDKAKERQQNDMNNGQPNDMNVVKDENNGTRKVGEPNHNDNAMEGDDDNSCGKTNKEVTRENEPQVTNDGDNGDDDNDDDDGNDENDSRHEGLRTRKRTSKEVVGHGYKREKTSDAPVDNSDFVSRRRSSRRITLIPKVE
eukprot:Awhi_evm1s7213